MKTIKNTSLAMRLTGWGIIFGLPTLFLLWPPGFQWGSHPNSPHDPFSPYMYMLFSIYYALAIILIRSAKEPRKHTGLIDFTIWSSVFHGLLMAVQSFILPHEMDHLIGDVPMILVIAWIFWYLHPNRVLD